MPQDASPATTPEPAKYSFAIDRGTIPVDKLAPSSAELDKATVAIIAKSIHEVGHLLHPIIVCKDGDTYIVVAGNHRLAAWRETGHTQVEVVVIPNDPKLRRRVTLTENIARNHWTGAKLLAAVEELKQLRGEVTEEEIAAAPAADPAAGGIMGQVTQKSPTPVKKSHKSTGTGRTGRPKSETSDRAVTATIAEQTGKTPEAVRSLVKRERDKQAPATPAKPVKAASPPDVAVDKLPSYAALIKIIDEVMITFRGEVMPAISRAVKGQGNAAIIRACDSVRGTLIGALMKPCVQEPPTAPPEPSSVHAELYEALSSGTLAAFDTFVNKWASDPRMRVPFVVTAQDNLRAAFETFLDAKRRLEAAKAKAVSTDKPPAPEPPVIVLEAPETQAEPHEQSQEDAQLSTDYRYRKYARAAVAAVLAQEKAEKEKNNAPPPPPTPDCETFIDVFNRGGLAIAETRFKGHPGLDDQMMVQAIAGCRAAQAETRKPDGGEPGAYDKAVADLTAAAELCMVSP